MPRLSQGVTLLELLVVLSVVAILVIAGTPSFFRLMARHRLQGVAESLFSDLQLARLEAVRRDALVTVSFHSPANGQHWCYAISDHGACRCQHSENCQMDGSTARIVRAAEFQRIFLQTNFYRQQTAFTPLRGALHAGTAILHNDFGSVRIIVSTLGRIRICSDELPLYPAC